jgi:hypothetical protein
MKTAALALLNAAAASTETARVRIAKLLKEVFM